MRRRELEVEGRAAHLAQELFEVGGLRVGVERVVSLKRSKCGRVQSDLEAGTVGSETFRLLHPRSWGTELR